MHKLFGVAAAAIMLFAVSSAEAQTRNTATSRMRMVRAYCTTGHCNSLFSSQSGARRDQRVKRPMLVSNRKLGNVRCASLLGLAGRALPGCLEAHVSGTVY